jgi:hypothetical protein
VFPIRARIRGEAIIDGVPPDQPLCLT